ncbi:MAG: histidine--tRNA ligase, partial [Chloroflexota bacterium]
EVEKIGKQLKYADRIGVSLAILLGPDELERGQVSIKDLRSGKQHTVARAECIGTITDLLEDIDSS